MSNWNTIKNKRKTFEQQSPRKTNSLQPPAHQKPLQSGVNEFFLLRVP